MSGIGANHKRFGACFLTALLFLSFLSKSSPLYPLNDWVDVNCIFTVGKGIFNGLVPYRDLYDQKGPLLFFVYGLAWLVSHDTFVGLFLLEVLAATGFLYFSLKIIDLFSSRAPMLWLPVLSAIYMTANSFSSGGSAEELCLPVLTFALYCALYMLKTHEPPRFKAVFIHGLAAGCLLWVKYSLIGVYIGYAFLVLLNLLKQKEYKRLLHTALLFLGGVTLVSIPVLAYFAVHAALGDLFTGYFYNNIFLYNTTAVFDKNIQSVVYKTAVLLYSGAWANMGLTLLIAAGFIGLAVKAVREKAPHVVPGALLIALCMVLTTYGGGIGYRYYFLVFAAFLPLGVAFLNTFFVKVRVMNRRWRGSMMAAIYLASIPLAFLNSTSTYLFLQKKESLAQYKLMQHMDLSNNPSILHVGVLDVGMNTITNTLPKQKYFCTLNAHIPQMAEAIDEACREGQADYLVERPFSVAPYLGALADTPLSSLLTPDLSKKYPKYELIASEKTLYEGVYYYIRLYKLKNN